MTFLGPYVLERKPLILDSYYFQISCHALELRIATEGWILNVCKNASTNISGINQFAS